MKQQRSDDINNNNDNNNDISVDDFLHNGMPSTIILIGFVIVSVILCFEVWNFLLFIYYDSLDQMDGNASEIRTATGKFHCFCLTPILSLSVCAYLIRVVFIAFR